MLTKKAITEAFKPLSHGLLREGKERNFGKVAGFPIEGTRMYNRPGSVGPAWSPYYRVGSVSDGKSGTAGPREHCIDWIYRHQK
jgi:hypothetical protein